MSKVFCTGVIHGAIDFHKLVDFQEKFKDEKKFENIIIFCYNIYIRLRKKSRFYQSVCGESKCPTYLKRE